MGVDSCIHTQREPSVIYSMGTVRMAVSCQRTQTLGCNGIQHYTRVKRRRVKRRRIEQRRVEQHQMQSPALCGHCCMLWSDCQCHREIPFVIGPKAPVEVTVRHHRGECSSVRMLLHAVPGCGVCVAHTDAHTTQSHRLTMSH